MKPLVSAKGTLCVVLVDPGKSRTRATLEVPSTLLTGHFQDGDRGAILKTLRFVRY